MKKLLLSLVTFAALSAQAQVIPLGSAGNMFTLLNANMHSVGVSTACSSVVFIHRSDPTVFATDNSAMYRYDVSTNNGGTFTLNQGVLNPSADNAAVSCRYPQCQIDNSANATNAANVYMQYLGTYHANGDWQGSTVGAARLDNAASTFTSTNAQINNGDIGVITSLSKGGPNTFWAISNALDLSNNFTGEIIVLKGTKSGNVVNWTTNKVLIPGWDVHKDYHGNSYNIDFDPSGQNGWISFLGDLRDEVDPNINEVYDINFYRTSDGGTTWEGPYIVNLNDFNLIQTVYPTPTTGTNVIHAVTTAFESDMAVDNNGEPHVFFGMGYGSSESEITAGNGYSVRASNFFDLSYDKNIDRFVLHFIDDVKQLRADSIGLTDNNGSLVANSEDNRLQVSKNEAGDNILFTWTDNIVVNIGGTDTVIDNNTARFLYGMNYNTGNGGVSQPRVLSTETPWISVAEKCYFHNASQYALSTSNSSILPIVYGVLNSDNTLESPAGFNYMQNVEFLEDSVAYGQQKDTLGFQVAPTWPVSTVNVTESTFAIYPNPASTHFLMTNITGRENTINIYAMNGSLVKKETFAASLVKNINIKDLASGTYIVELVSDGKAQQTKLIKQ
ncbi:MAG: T9SS type A sorting domain-containing protein [Chitinophagaceae bacterium]